MGDVIIKGKESNEQALITYFAMWHCSWWTEQVSFHCWSRIV
jgi:hypothetical protein